MLQRLQPGDGGGVHLLRGVIVRAVARVHDAHGHVRLRRVLGELPEVSAVGPVQRREGVVVAPNELNGAGDVGHELLRRRAGVAREDAHEDLEGIRVVGGAKDGAHELAVDAVLIDVYASKRRGDVLLGLGALKEPAAEALVAQQNVQQREDGCGDELKVQRREVVGDGELVVHAPGAVEEQQALGGGVLRGGGDGDEAADGVPREDVIIVGHDIARKAEHLLPPQVDGVDGVAHRLVRETEAEQVQREDVVARGGERRDVLAEVVRARAEAVDKQQGALGGPGRLL
mmetsp:Transcript_33325/g.105341  ORF Transcript_33325/g.105341 Transcript_33325/m.105341 type:complete len:287 (-) Transcript_33325:204-1064(-)